MMIYGLNSKRKVFRRLNTIQAWSIPRSDIISGTVRCSSFFFYSFLLLGAGRT